jgi:hypothetical protein
MLDLDLLIERRDLLHELHMRLAQLPPPDQLALIGDVRSERRAAQQEISKAERLLEESWRLLTEALEDDIELDDAEGVVDHWRSRGQSGDQATLPSF